MPLYDIRCRACSGIFERLLPLAKLHSEIACPYCAAAIPAAPMPSTAAAVRVLHAWRPRSKLEQLAGKKVSGPGAATHVRRSNVLHVCKGSDCSICGT